MSVSLCVYIEIIPIQHIVRCCMPKNSVNPITSCTAAGAGVTGISHRGTCPRPQYKKHNDWIRGPPVLFCGIIVSANRIHLNKWPISTIQETWVVVSSRYEVLISLPFCVCRDGCWSEAVISWDSRGLSTSKVGVRMLYTQSGDSYVWVSQKNVIVCHGC